MGLVTTSHMGCLDFFLLGRKLVKKSIKSNAFMSSVRLDPTWCSCSPRDFLLPISSCINVGVNMGHVTIWLEIGKSRYNVFMFV